MFQLIDQADMKNVLKDVLLVKRSPDENNSVSWSICFLGSDKDTCNVLFINESKFTNSQINENLLNCLELTLNKVKSEKCTLVSKSARGAVGYSTLGLIPYAMNDMVLSSKNKQEILDKNFELKDAINAMITKNNADK